MATLSDVDKERRKATLGWLRHKRTVAAIAAEDVRKHLLNGTPLTGLSDRGFIIEAFKELISLSPMEHPQVDEYVIDHDVLVWFLKERLGHLAVLSAEVAALEEEIKEEISYARDAGVTWAEIAEVAGIKPQSAYQRWSEQGREKHRVNQRKRRVQE